MKLYNVVGSPNCRKVLAVAAQLGIKLDIEYLDFFAGDLRKPEYLALNPNAMVPVLQDGDFVLWESNAIMQYLADTVPGNSLFPRDPQLRADVVRWLCWELAHFNKALGILAYETVLKPGLMKMEPDVEAVRIAQSNLERNAPVLDGHLRGKTWLVGKQITLADYAVAHIENFQAAVPFDWKPYANITAHFERVRADKHWQATAAPSMEALGRKPAGK